MPQSRLQNT